MDNKAEGVADETHKQTYQLHINTSPLRQCGLSRPQSHLSCRARLIGLRQMMQTALI
jgi:hypothetical protein